MVEVFFNDTATSEIYTLSLHDALPIFEQVAGIEVGLAAELLDALGDAVSVLAFGIGVLFEFAGNRFAVHAGGHKVVVHVAEDRKSTRLNSSHMSISYAVFCLKKKK